MKVRIVFVIGKRDINTDAARLRVHGKSNLGAKPRAEAITESLESINQCRAG